MAAAENALIRNAHLFGGFQLERTYLGTRIREYDEKVDNRLMEPKVELISDDEDGELTKERPRKRIKKDELTPVMISESEESTDTEEES